MKRIPYGGRWIETDISSESDCDENVQEKLKSVEHFQNGGTSRHIRDVNSNWLSLSSWKLEPFKEKLPPTERKAEWRRFRDQFQRNLDCRSPVDPETNLKVLKLLAGCYLLKVIEMKEASLVLPVDNIYLKVVSLVNNYFDATCNPTQERIKFREMTQKGDESFTDWVLRLESQSKFCEFKDEQRKEELLQALMGKSVPELSEQLYVASSFLGNDLDKMIQHGQHLDNKRIQKAEAFPTSMLDTEVPSNDSATRPVMYVGKREGYYKGRGINHNSSNRFEPYNRNNRNNFNSRKECERCGKFHAPNKCPAYRSKCGKCGRFGHWVAKCQSNVRGNESEQDKKTGVLKHISRINKVDDSE